MANKLFIPIMLAGALAAAALSAFIAASSLSARADAHASLSAYTDIASRRAFYEAEGRRMESAMAALPKKRIALDERGAAVSTVVARVSSSGMKLIAFDPGDAANGILPISITAEGSFAAAMRLLSDIERLPYAVKEETVTMEKSPGGVTLTVRLSAGLQ